MKKKSILGEFMNNEAKKLGFDNKISNIHYTKIKRPIRNRELRRIDELAEDIREDGLENNLLVRKKLRTMRMMLNLSAFTSGR